MMVKKIHHSIVPSFHRYQKVHEPVNAVVTQSGLHLVIKIICVALLIVFLEHVVQSVCTIASDHLFHIQKLKRWRISFEMLSTDVVCGVVGLLGLLLWNTS